MKCSTTDEMIAASDTGIRKRFSYTPEQLSKFKEIFKKMEAEKGGPVLIHEIHKYIMVNKVAEFKKIGYVTFL